MAGKGSQILRELGRIETNGYDDYQHVRTEMWNRVRCLIRAINEGLSPGKPEEKKDGDQDFEAKYQDGNLPQLLKEMAKQGKISDKEYDYLKKAIELAKKARSFEHSFVGPMGKIIGTESLWTEFLVHVRGIGVILGAKLIAKIGHCDRYDHVSSMLRHFGFHLVCPKCLEEKIVLRHVDGKCTKCGSDSVTACPKCSEKKMIPQLAGSDGKCPKCNSPGVGPKRRMGQGIDYDPKLRSLAWNIAASLVKQKSPVYYEIYDGEKDRQMLRVYPVGELVKIYGKPYTPEATHLNLIHAHNRALRKMVKIFLQHCWIVSRREAGLPVSEPYVQSKLGHQDIITPADVLAANENDSRNKKSEAA